MNPKGMTAEELADWEVAVTDDDRGAVLARLANRLADDLDRLHKQCKRQRNEMSADNWMACPRCLAQQEASHRERLAEVNRQYGKVPAEEFIAALQEAEKPLEIEENFREDYELGLSTDGSFYVSYTGRCILCEFTFTFKWELDADAVTAEAAKGKTK